MNLTKVVRILQLVGLLGGLLSFFSLEMSGQIDSARRIALPNNVRLVQPVQTIEDAPLDIPQDRGLFVTSGEEKLLGVRGLQLRVLGSIRYLGGVDFYELANKESFLPTNIATGENSVVVPGYFNSLSRSRLGFEVLRSTSAGDIFLRIETDFNGSDGFRIRHAYGQYDAFTFGQTWSLFSNVMLLPAMVDADGPMGSITLRTPQVRFNATDMVQNWFGESLSNTQVALSLEAVDHEFKQTDSSAPSSIQLLPDPVLRIQQEFSWGSGQFSAIIPMLAGRFLNDNELRFRVGFGLNAAVSVPVGGDGVVSSQVSVGQGITSFLAPFVSEAMDVLVDSTQSRAYLPLTVSGFAAYTHSWQSWLRSTLSFGVGTLEPRAWAPSSQFQWGYAVQANTFWDVIEGARIGIELAVGGRTDIGGDTGSATRIVSLFYYDF